MEEKERRIQGSTGEQIREVRRGEERRQKRKMKKFNI